MDAPVWIAGAGVITAIGNNIRECVDSLRNNRSGITPISFVDTIHKTTFPVGEVKLSNSELADLTRLDTSITRTALLSMVAAREAYNYIPESIFTSARKGFISANSVGGMDKTESFYRQYYSDHAKGNMQDVRNHECSRSTEIVADALGIRQNIFTINTACSSSANSIALGARLIKHNIIDIAIAGGTDSLTRFTINGFNSLQILDPDPCKPFDKNRQGLNLGEGAGYLLLISDKIKRQYSQDIFCRLSGYANANDAHHQTASSPEGNGSYLAMNAAITKASINTNDINYINLHGTGTQNNDLSEGTAIMRLFGDTPPPVSSTKSFTGHTLGACGGVEAVFSALSVRDGMIYANLRFKEKIEELSFSPVTIFSEGNELNHVMSNSFGFGGNCSSLIFSKA